VNSGPRDRVLDAIYASIGELNSQLEPASQLKLSPETVLYGESGQLNSLNLVELLVVAEQRIEDDFGVSLTLADEHALVRTTSPFRTVATLVDYVEERLRGEAVE
jgi:acyl carrier protein